MKRLALLLVLAAAAVGAGCQEEPSDPYPPESGAAGIPSSSIRNWMKDTGAGFWLAEGKSHAGDCVQNATIEFRYPNESFYRQAANGNTYRLTLGSNLAEAFGCNAPNWNVGSGNIVFNRSLVWGPHKGCTVSAHEHGHLVGYGHGGDGTRDVLPIDSTGGYRIMRIDREPAIWLPGGIPGDPWYRWQWWNCGLNPVSALAGDQGDGGPTLTDDPSSLPAPQYEQVDPDTRQPVSDSSAQASSESDYADPLAEEAPPE